MVNFASYAIIMFDKNSISIEDIQMQFTSYEFVFLFLPLTVLFYYLVNKFSLTIGKIVLIVASIIFYSFGRHNMLYYLSASILINYSSVLIIQKRQITNKIVLSLPIVINVSLLLYFKYLNFAITNINIITGGNIALRQILLPLGISFYTFQQIAYIVASERGTLENDSLIDYLAYILYFPKLIMGPLVDPADFIFQLNDVSRKKPNINAIASGIKIFSLGLIKKVLFADTFALAVKWVYDNLESATSVECMLLALFYTFEIYFDFSGYSDMAIGISSMFGIDLPINFDSPYKAISIRDFWKRWHISLTKFLTNYIYIPLGGSKKGIAFTYFNTLIVFLVSGLWHGANWSFILWGLLHGLFSCFDRACENIENKVFKPIRWMFTFGIVNILWLLFSAESVEQWIAILKKIMALHGRSISSGLMSTFDLLENNFIFNSLGLSFLPTKIRGLNMLIFIVAAFFICLIPECNYKQKDKLGLGSMILASFSFIWGVLFLGSESVFVYFGF